MKPKPPRPGSTERTLIGNRLFAAEGISSLTQKKKLYVFRKGKDDDCVGTLEWRPGIRRYGFLPEEGTMVDREGLLDLVAFLDSLDRRRK